MKIIFIVVFALCVCLDTRYTEATECRTLKGEKGECVSINECPALAKLAHKKNITRQDIDLLRKSRCSDDLHRHVCCAKPRQPEDECYTPEGEIGSCISIYLCSHLVNKLKPPVSAQNMNYVRKSGCKSNIQYSVCCGPPPNCTALMTASPPEPWTECCGVDSRVSNKLVGGTATAIDQYPWLIIIEYESEGGMSLLCGGALISGKYVLTAAHCVTGAVLEAGIPTRVRLGEYDTAHEGADCSMVEGDSDAEDCNDGAISIDIEKIIMHPKYNPKNFQKTNDIALLRLKETAPFTYFIRPICLPTLDRTKAGRLRSSLHVAGWGAVSLKKLYSNIKLHVELPFVPQDSCQQVYNDIESNKTLWRGQLCAGGVVGKDSCKGDSGGPLMYEDGKSYEVLGIVSYGLHPCGEAPIPGVYSNVYEYLDWIKETIVP